MILEIVEVERTAFPLDSWSGWHDLNAELSQSLLIHRQFRFRYLEGKVSIRSLRRRRALHRHKPDSVKHEELFSGNGEVLYCTVVDFCRAKTLAQEHGHSFQIANDEGDVTDAFNTHALFTANGRIHVPRYAVAWNEILGARIFRWILGKPLDDARHIGLEGPRQ